MKCKTIVFFLCCSIGLINCSMNVQDYIDSLLKHEANPSELIENDPVLFNRIYEYFQIQYRKEENFNKKLDFKRSHRMQIFKSNLKYILEHNRNPFNRFQLKINEMSDWTDQERDQLRTRMTEEELHRNHPIQSRLHIQLPDSFDWTNQTRIPFAVTPVKNQRHCGSCYAFAMVGALEKTYAQLYNQSGPLSPQELVDCSYANGCEGGSFTDTFNYIRDKGFRLSLEKDYPSTSDGKQNEKCQKKQNGVLLTINNKYPLQYEQLPSENESYMKQVLFARGPIYFSFNCGKREGNDTMLREVSNKFDHYASGIFDVPGCPAYRNMNHALVIVGYGTDNGIDYWKVKNSWGSSWGDQGYIKIRRNQNMCGIASFPYYVGLF